MIKKERTEQEDLIQWCEKHQDPRLRLIYSHLNGMRSTAQTYIKERKSGARKGLPDLFLPVALEPYHGLYVELKREKNGKVSDDQKMMIYLLRQQGYAVEVANGAQEAKLIIKKYLEGQPWKQPTIK